MRHKIILLTLGISLLGFAGCSGWPTSSQGGFTYQDIPMTSDSVQPGERNTILFRGTPLALTGQTIQTGEVLRDAMLTKSDLSLTNLQDSRGTVRIISIVPSIDTKVCEQQTHYLSEKNHGLDQHVRLITISVDTPFAQQRFAKEAGIGNVEFLSDYRGGQFGQAYGLLLEDPHVLSRGIMVVDEQNIIRYFQLTPDLGHMPDMDKAFQVARDLLP
jgi:thioredoxin-dependent peroxiredoxin